MFQLSVAAQHLTKVALSHHPRQFCGLAVLSWAVFTGGLSWGCSQVVSSVHSTGLDVQDGFLAPCQTLGTPPHAPSAAEKPGLLP